MKLAFSQPNAKVCEKMLKWSLDVTNNSDKDTDDLLELYCGGGTFTAALASNFRTVIATEISKASVELAHKTFKANNIKNIKVARYILILIINTIIIITVLDYHQKSLQKHITIKGHFKD